MQNVIWKAFKLGKMLTVVGTPNTACPAKALNISKEQQDGMIALVNSGRENNGVVGFIDKTNFASTKNKITYSDNFGLTFFHDYEFTLLGGGHLYILEPASNVLSNIFNDNAVCGGFVSTVINHVLAKSVYNYMYKANDYRFDREIILLPCLEVAKGSDYIWEDNGKYYTLAVDFIKELMEQAKERKEEKTIKLYEAEKAKYEADYLKEQDEVVWKSFKLGELFETSTEHYLEKSKKNYNISETQTETHTVAVCAASKINNGIVGYIEEVDDIPNKKRKGFLTKGGFGHCFYQPNWFIKPGGSWGMLDIIKIKSQRFKSVLDKETLGYLFLAKNLTKIFTSMASWGYAVPFDREIILLPCLEVAKGSDYIWEDNGKYYTLAKNTVCYLYLKGQSNIQQRKIENYTYKY